MRRRDPVRRTGWRVIETRAPRKGTVLIAAVLYIAGVAGEIGWLNLPRPYPFIALAVAGGLLLLGSLLRDL